MDFRKACLAGAMIPDHQHRSRMRVIQIQQNRQPIGGDPQEQRLRRERSDLRQDLGPGLARQAPAGCDPDPMNSHPG